MYEPNYLPVLKSGCVAIPPLRFAVYHNNRYVRCDDPNADPLHIHEHLEIFFNLSSDVSFLINGSLYPVPSGGAVIARAGDIHMGLFHKSAVQEYICVWIGSDFASPLFSFLGQEDFCPLFLFDAQTKKQVSSLAFTLLEEYEKDGSELERISCLLQLLTLLKNRSDHAIGQAQIPDALQRILDDVNDNFSTIRNVNDILQAHFISSATLTRWFRKHLHSSPREYLESVRLFNAVRLLESGCTVTEACMRTGFSDCSHFIILFKKKFGTTPLQYKKNIKRR